MEVDGDSLKDAAGDTAQDWSQTGWKGDENGERGYTSEPSRSGKGLGDEEGSENERGNPEVDEVRAYWQRYKRQEQNNEGPLSFNTICWPMLVDPRTLSKVKMEETVEALEKFLLSPLHSQGLSPKQRINAALLRWHPDKGMRLLQRLRDEDERASATLAITSIAACLTSMRNNSMGLSDERGLREV